MILLIDETKTRFFIKIIMQLLRESIHTEKAVELSLYFFQNNLIFLFFLLLLKYNQCFFIHCVCALLQVHIKYGLHADICRDPSEKIQLTKIYYITQALQVNKQQSEIGDME